MVVAGSGTVERVVTVDGSAEGINVRIKHDDGTQTFYLHLSKTLVNEGDKVGAGTPIGAVGNTGRSYGAHLHFSR